MRKPLLAIGILAATSSLPARAERLVSAFDPTLHVRPPLAKRIDGTTGPLELDADFAARADQFRRTHPPTFAARGAAVRSGEVLILEGDSDLLQEDGTGGWGIGNKISAISRRVIESAGDKFHAITLFLTFDDKSSPGAMAYELNVKNEVEGLGPTMTIKDMSGAFGSAGVLRSMLNMKRTGLLAGDTYESWSRDALPTWGQESAHRWMMFFMVRDPRTGRNSDALLGRDCAHYSRFVDTQASVQDGFAWRDNGNGTFTATESNRRYGDLDLYGMGLLAPDEVPPFFFIDDIPNYTYPACGRDYDRAVRPSASTIRGTRVDVTIEDVIAANGERRPTADERQDYWREAIVVVTRPGETADSPVVQRLAERLNRARLWWESWNQEASRNRLVMCTQISGDCGDPRSDVTSVAYRSAGKGALTFDVEVANDGGRAATGVDATVEVVVNGKTLMQTKALGTLAPGARRMESFRVEGSALACGTEAQVKAFTQSDFHYSRKKTAIIVGVEAKHADGFEAESGWTVNPDGTDSTSGAAWERGRPEETEILKRRVQPGAAQAGQRAWVTGAAAAGAAQATYVRQGRATLQSPPYDSSALRDASVRYWVSFAGVRASTGGALEPSPASRLTVFARALDAAGAPAGDWTSIDVIENEITNGWVQRSAPIDAALTSRGKLQLRFVAEDGNPAQGGVEAAIDEVEILSTLPSCFVATKAGGDGGGCAVGGSFRGGAVVPIGLAGVLALFGRRRRRG